MAKCIKGPDYQEISCQEMSNYGVDEDEIYCKVKGKSTWGFPLFDCFIYYLSLTVRKLFMKEVKKENNPQV